MQMHDEIIVEVKEYNVETCAQVMRKAMENVFESRGFKLNFPIKLLRGKSWGSLAPF